MHVRAFGHPGAHGWHAADFARALVDDAHILVSDARGYAVARVTLDEAELLLIAVLPEARREGVARKLFAELETLLRARDVRRVFLEVVETNAAARSFYHSHGFEVSGERKNYYGRGPGHGAVLMEKALN